MAKKKSKKSQKQAEKQAESVTVADTKPELEELPSVPEAPALAPEPPAPPAEDTAQNEVAEPPTSPKLPDPVDPPLEEPQPTSAVNEPTSVDNGAPAEQADAASPPEQAEPNVAAEACQSSKDASFPVSGAAAATAEAELLESESIGLLSNSTHGDASVSTGPVSSEIPSAIQSELLAEEKVESNAHVTEPTSSTSTQALESDPTHSEPDKVEPATAPEPEPASSDATAPEPEKQLEALPTNSSDVAEAEPKAAVKDISEPTVAEPGTSSLSEQPETVPIEETSQPATEEHISKPEQESEATLEDAPQPPQVDPPDTTVEQTLEVDSQTPIEPKQEEASKADPEEVSQTTPEQNLTSAIEQAPEPSPIVTAEPVSTDTHETTEETDISVPDAPKELPKEAPVSVAAAVPQSNPERSITPPAPEEAPEVTSTFAEDIAPSPKKQSLPVSEEVPRPREEVQTSLSEPAQVPAPEASPKTVPAAVPHPVAESVLNSSQSSLPSPADTSEFDRKSVSSERRSRAALDSAGVKPPRPAPFRAEQSRPGSSRTSIRSSSPPRPEAAKETIEDNRPPWAAPTPPVRRARARHISAFDDEDDEDDDSALIHPRLRGEPPSRDPLRGLTYPPSQAPQPRGLYASRVPQPPEHYSNQNPTHPPPPGYHPRYYPPQAPPYYHSHNPSMSQSGGYSNHSPYGPPSHASSPYQESWSQFPPNYPPYGSPPPGQRHDSLASREYALAPHSMDNGSAIDDDTGDLFGRIAQAIPDLHVLLSRYKETHGQLGVREELLRRASAEQQERLKNKDDEIQQLKDRIASIENKHSNEASRLRFEIGNLEEQVKELREQLMEIEIYKKEAEETRVALEAAKLAWETRYKELELAHAELERVSTEEKIKTQKDFDEWKTTSNTKHDAEKIALAIQFDKRLKEADVLAENQMQEATASFITEKDELRSEHSRQQRDRESSFDRVRKELETKLSTAQKDREEALRHERESREVWEIERENLSKAHQEDRESLQRSWDEQRELTEAKHKKMKDESDKAWIELHADANRKAEDERAKAESLAKQLEDLQRKYDELKAESSKEKDVIKSVAGNLELEKARLERLMECYGDIAEIKSKGDTYYLVSFSQLQKQILDLADTHFKHLPITPPPGVLENIPPELPSFLGNTDAARQLRSAYVAHTVSAMVTFRVFGPFLFSLGRRYDKADSLFLSMSNHIRDKSTRKEAIWRQQTLLAAFTSSGAKQRINTAAGSVVEEIVTAVKYFADPREEEAIKIAVRRIVKLAAETWRFARLEREMITATMPAVYDQDHEFAGPDYWSAHKTEDTPIASLAGTAVPDERPKLLLRIFPVIHREPKHENLRAADEPPDEGCIYHHGLALYDDAKAVETRREEIKQAGLPPANNPSPTAADFPEPIIPPPCHPPPPPPVEADDAASIKSRTPTVVPVPTSRSRPASLRSDPPSHPPPPPPVEADDAASVKSRAPTVVPVPTSRSRPASIRSESRPKSIKDEPRPESMVLGNSPMEASMSDLASPSPGAQAHGFDFALSDIHMAEYARSGSSRPVSMRSEASVMEEPNTAPTRSPYVRPLPGPIQFTKLDDPSNSVPIESTPAASKASSRRASTHASCISIPQAPPSPSAKTHDDPQPESPTKEIPEAPPIAPSTASSKVHLPPGPTESAVIPDTLPPPVTGSRAVPTESIVTPMPTRPPPDILRDAVQPAGQRPPTPPGSRSGTPPPQAPPSPLFEAVDEIEALQPHRRRKSSASARRVASSRASNEDLKKDKPDTARRISGYSISSKPSVDEKSLRSERSDKSMRSERSERSERSSHSRYTCESRSAAVKALYPNSPLAGTPIGPSRSNSVRSSKKQPTTSGGGTWDTSSVSQETQNNNDEP